MRALSLALALLGAALLAPGAQATELACIPEAPPCSFGILLCPPLAGTFGWCVEPMVHTEGGSVHAVAGNHPGPRVWTQAHLVWWPGVGLAATYGADLCTPWLAIVEPPVGPPTCMVG